MRDLNEGSTENGKSGRRRKVRNENTSGRKVNARRITLKMKTENGRSKGKNGKRDVDREREGKDGRSVK